VITSHIRTTSRQEVLQRLRDHWGRINHLINTEALEGAELETDQQTTGCKDDTKSGLTIYLPGRSHPIHYYTVFQEDSLESSLWRCGPDVEDNGQLADETVQDFQPVTTLVAKHAALAAKPDSETEERHHEMGYTLTLTAQSNGQAISYEAASRAETTARTYPPPTE
jgi:hypothetical protein